MPTKLVDLIHRYLPVAALSFAAIYLIHIDFGKIEVSLPAFILSLLVLLSLFFFRVYIWFLFLREIDRKITFNICIISRFRFILTKYIPGKLWLYLGAGSVQQKYTDINFVDGTVNAMSFQVVNNISGFLVGGLGLSIYLEGPLSVFCFLATSAAMIAFFYFLSQERKMLSLTRYAFLRKFVKGYTYNLPACSNIFILLLVQWVLLGISYYFFFKASHFNVDINVVFLQPLANNIGMISVFTPGGIGVREGFMVFYLNQLGFQLQEATLMAVMSRFWFLAVEIIAFFVGVIIERRLMRSKNATKR